MKKILFAIAALVLLFVCAVSASAAEQPVKMELTAQPDKIIYSAGDAVKRTETVYNEATQSLRQTEYNYYPLSFAGLEITFTYADDTTRIYAFDEVLSLVGNGFSILNKTVQNAENPWAADNFYDVVLACGELEVTYQVLVTGQEENAAEKIAEIGISVYPEKSIYLESEAVDAAEFDENGNAVSYKAYPVDLNGLVLYVEYADGSVLHCTPAMLNALTGLEMQIDDTQSADIPWQLGANTVVLTFGEFRCRFFAYVDVKDHLFEEYFSADNDTHEADCVYCEQTFVFACEGGEATCTERAVCIYCEEPYGETLPHDTYFEHTATTHTELCRNCDYEDPDLAHEMTAGEYDTEKQCALYSCSVCGYQVNAQAVGDVNGDGKITADDARETLRASAGLTTFTERQLLLSDADGDGVLGAGDARIILRTSAGLEKLTAIVPVEKNEDENS